MEGRHARSRRRSPTRLRPGAPVGADAGLASPVDPAGASMSPAGDDLDLGVGWDRFDKLVQRSSSAFWAHAMSSSDGTEHKAMGHPTHPAGVSLRASLWALWTTATLFGSDAGSARNMSSASAVDVPGVVAALTARNPVDTRRPILHSPFCTLAGDSYPIRFRRGHAHNPCWSRANGLRRTRPGLGLPRVAVQRSARLQRPPCAVGSAPAAEGRPVCGKLPRRRSVANDLTSSIAWSGPPHAASSRASGEL